MGLMTDATKPGESGKAPDDKGERKIRETATAVKQVDPRPTKRIRIREDSIVDVVRDDEADFTLKRGETVDADATLADRLLARPGQEVELLDIHEHGAPASN